MAGKGKPGPAPGEGGRPRTKNPKPRKDGYKRVTKGPKGDGEQMYEHRAKMGMAPGSGSKGKGTVVHHADGNRSNNDSGNLSRVSKAENNKKKRRRG